MWEGKGEKEKKEKREKENVGGEESVYNLSILTGLWWEGGCYVRFAASVVYVTTEEETALQI